MKVVVATVLILITFFLGAFMLNGYIDSSCESLLENINILYKSVEDESWIEAGDQIVDLQEEWENIKKKWQLFLEHYEMDAIDIAITRLYQYIKIEDRVSSLGELGEFKLLISHIRDKEALKLENIL